MRYVKLPDLWPLTFDQAWTWVVCQTVSDWKRLICKYYTRVAMTNINACILRFFHLNNAWSPRVSALWCEKSKNKCIDFCHSHIKRIISVINLIYTQTILECIYFETRLNYQNNLNFIRNPVQYDHRRPKWIMLTLHWYARVTCSYATQWRNYALSDINEWFGIGLFRFLNSCHWLL